MSGNTAHWHIATGLAGHGPDGSDGFHTATEIRGLGGLCDQLSEQLTGHSWQSHELAHAYGQSEAYEDAWKEILRSEELETLAANFAPKREDMPLYSDNKELFEKRIREMVGANFPLDVSPNTRLYVWECCEPDCEHLNETE